MQLTLYTDYSLRVLIYLGARPDSKATITEITQYYGISRNHLVKVVHNLSSHGYIHTHRGKGGGMQLARPPQEINIGDVVLHTEANFHIVTCFDAEQPPCRIQSMCTLKGVLESAHRSFMVILNGYTLADLLPKPDTSPKPVRFMPRPHRPPPHN